MVGGSMTWSSTLTRIRSSTFMEPPGAATGSWLKLTGSSG
jgi:hypothetical protein